jgi:hypothetical protein
MRKFTAACAALMLALGACSAQPESGGQEVASLSTSGSGAAPTSAAQEERPRERLDMTPEDIEALNAPHQRCLSEHGVDKNADQKPSKEVLDKANKACMSKKPLPPWEKDASNPESLDFANRVVQCLRDKGVRYVEVWTHPESEEVGVAYGGPNNDQQSITLGLQYTKECEIAASKK